MNGRLYDPVMARFVSADPTIQAPGSLQSYNRYTYVLNNPLYYTDPSGYFFGLDDLIIAVAIIGGARATNIIDTQTARGLIGIAAGVFLGQPGGLLGGSFAGAVATGGITGGISSGWDGVGPGMLSGGLFYGAGFVGEELSLARVGAHAVAGCIGASASGGDCGSGALSAGFAQFAGPRLPNLGDYGNAIARAILGGTASVLGGGKFESGAMTGAFGYLFNEMAVEHDECKMLCHEVKYNPGEQMPEADQKTMALGVLGAAATVLVPEVVAGRIVGVAIKETEIAVRTTRSGEKAARITKSDGSVIDISPQRVKEYVPSSHPNAPAGTLDRVKFQDALPGSKGYKRVPTQAELEILRSAK